MSKPRAVLYFTATDPDLAKEVAASIRLAGNECHLVDASRFDAEKGLEDAQAVIVQSTSNNMQKIIEAYRTYKPGTELHLFDELGDLMDPPDAKFSKPPSEPNEDAQKQEEIVDTTSKADEVATSEDEADVDTVVEADDIVEPDPKKSKRTSK